MVSLIHGMRYFTREYIPGELGRPHPNPHDVTPYIVYLSEENNKQKLEVVSLHIETYISLIPACINKLNYFGIGWNTR